MALARVRDRTRHWRWHENLNTSSIVCDLIMIRVAIMTRYCRRAGALPVRQGETVAHDPVHCLI